MHADIERGIRKRIDHNRAAARMGDGYRQAAVDREILILELDKLRHTASRIRGETNADPSNDALHVNSLEFLLDQLLGVEAPHHPV
jgi:hypothetical protein